MTVQISPSLAAGDLCRIADEVAKLEQSGADSIHFDCMDGHFVPLLTIGVPVLAQVRKLTKMHLDVHIMVTNPDAVFEQYLEAGADTLSFPVEAALHPHRISQKIRSLNKRVGVALNPGTHWRTVEFLLPYLDQVIVMGVNPGFSRQQHIAGTAQKIKELRDFCKQQQHKLDIMVDGGVNKDNAQMLFHAGANILVAGGYVFNQSNYHQAVSELKSVCTAKVTL